MAKDGTARGGQRPGSGRKPKALSEKMLEGRPIDVITDIPTLEPVDLEGEDMPKPKDYMTAKQRNGKNTCAEEIFNSTWIWLKERGCEKAVNIQLVEQYAMSVARWVQCEELINEKGFLAKHPTTGEAMTSPYVSISQQYMKQINQAWYQIFQVVKETCTSPASLTPDPQNDLMESLLRRRKSG